MPTKKPPRAEFALPGGTKSNPAPGYPLNTPGRVAAAPGLAARSEKMGNISKAQESKVNAAAAHARGASAKPDPKPVAPASKPSNLGPFQHKAGASMANRCPTCGKPR